MTKEQNNGLAFEKWVVQLYKDLGMPRVRHNIMKKTRGTWSQFDIVYGYFFDTYVECKYKSKKYLVSLNEVATFHAKLDLCNITSQQGVLITNSFFDKRSYVYAKDCGLKLIDKPKLYSLHKERLTLWQQVQTIYKPNNLESILQKDLKQYT